MKSEVILETALPADNPEVKGKVEKKGGKRIGYNYIVLKSLKEHPKNDVVKCIYIKSLTNFGICVIKEGTFDDVKDKEGRDIKDRLVWQKKLHELLHNKVRVPKLIGSFEENGNYYLAIEHIKGKTLGGLCKKYGRELREALITGNKKGIRFLGYLLKIIDVLDTMHKNHVVHRDVTAANFIITPGGNVAIIDMELSYSLQEQMPSPPFELGTYGYMSPEQLSVATPTIKEDVFSIGAILLQVWTGIAPVKLTEAPLDELEGRINFFIPDKEIANTIFQCLHPEAEKRPALKSVYQVLESYRKDLKSKKIRDVQKPEFKNREQIKETIRQVINTLASPLLASTELGWFAENRNIHEKKLKNSIHKSWYASFHVGCSGVLYFLSRAHRMGFDIEINRPHIQEALLLIEEKYINRAEQALPGLHFGSDGIAASLAEALRSGLIIHADKYRDWIDALLKKRAGLLGILPGIAGQGMANLISAGETSGQDAALRLREYAQHLISKQDKNGAWVREVNNNIKGVRITRGIAFGVAGIVCFLLEYVRLYDDKDAIASAKQGLDWLIKNAVKNKTGIEWHSSDGGRIAPWWCDGGPGIALAFMRAYALFGDPVYKKIATDALNSHPLRIFENNLGQHNGLSGLGEIYLEAYGIFRDDQWMERAEWIAQIIMRMKKYNPKYGPYWLVEHERQPVSGFMLGNTGVLHFLLRYCYPDRIDLPMMTGYTQAKDFENPLIEKQSILLGNGAFL